MNREVVYCKTKDEWEFICEKQFNNKDWVRFKELSCLNPPNKLGNGNSWCDKSWYEKEKDTIYSFEDWCIKFNLKPEFNKQPEFIVGKWYKIIKEPSNAKYIKYKTTANNGYYECSCFIDNTKLINFRGTFGICTSNSLIEVSLEEIQQYLPENHIDKIVKIKDKFEKGDYIIDITSNNCIKLGDSIGSGWWVYDSSYYSGRGYGYGALVYYININTKWRYASKEEIKEYNRLGKYYNINILSNSIKSIELTSLPEKWYIKSNYDIENILKDWRGCGYNGTIGSCVLLSTKMWVSIKCNLKDYIEITFEQFKKWVLKEEIESEELIVCQDSLKYNNIPPEQWQVGDLVECLDGYPNVYTKGKIYIISKIGNNYTSINTIVDDKGSNNNGWGASKFKFHSRPNKSIIQDVLDVYKRLLNPTPSEVINLIYKDSKEVFNSTLSNLNDEQPIIIKQKKNKPKIFTINN